MGGAFIHTLFVAMVLVIEWRPGGQNNQIIRLDEFEMFVAQLLVFLGIEGRIEEDSPVFVSKFSQRRCNFRESPSVADFRWLCNIARANRRRIREAMIQAGCFHICHAKVTPSEGKLKGN